MALDPRIPLMAQGMNLEPRSNALMRASQLEGSQQSNALRQMQMQQMQQAAQQSLMDRQAAAQREQSMMGYLQSMSGQAGPPQPFNPAEASQRLGIDGAKKLQELMANSANMGRAKVARTVEIAGPDGKPMTVQLDEFGGTVGNQMPKPVEMKLANTGGAQTPYNPFAQTAPIPMTLTPSQIQSNATTIRGQNMTDGRARERMTFDRQQAEIKAKTPGADKPATEGERKAATLLTRLRGSQSQLEAALKDTPEAAKPELLAESARKFPFLGGDVPANVVTSGPRQQVEAAQLDLLDAALTLGTGAAYTREQLLGYQKAYFPQIGDDKKTVADKQDRLKNVIRAAEIAAGRAEPEAPKFGGNAGNVTVDY